MAHTPDSESRGSGDLGDKNGGPPDRARDAGMDRDRPSPAPEGSKQTANPGRAGTPAGEAEDEGPVESLGKAISAPVRGAAEDEEKRSLGR